MKTKQTEINKYVDSLKKKKDQLKNIHLFYFVFCYYKILNTEFMYVLHAIYYCYFGLFTSHYFYKSI